MNRSDYFAWSLFAFGPTFVGLCGIGLVLLLQEQKASNVILVLWLCFSVLSCLVAGVWWMDQRATSKFGKWFLGSLVGLLLAALNVALVAIIFFGGCALLFAL